MTIKQKQCLLVYMECLPASGVDGVWGPQSARATEDAQRKLGVSVSGIWDAATDTAIREHVYSGEAAPEAATTGTFWDEIEFFTRDEFKCKCGGKYCNGYPAEPQEKLVRIANQLRKNLGVPVTIVSGLRCPTHNANEGGVANSQHVYGEAADVYARGVSQAAVEAELDRIGGVRYHYPIKNSNNVHFDIPKVNR